MKTNKVIWFIAIIYNLINLLFWTHINNMPDATSMIYVVVYPAYWILTIVLFVILAIRNRFTWFSKSHILSTIILFILCTPLPFMAIVNLNSPTSYKSSTGFLLRNNYTIKYESWFYYSGTLQVIKYWRANKPNCQSCDSSAFRKDSIWIYFNKSGDTVKIETYKNDKLINLNGTSTL